jgi:hypothetical protein
LVGIASFSETRASGTAQAQFGSTGNPESRKDAGECLMKLDSVWLATKAMFRY